METQERNYLVFKTMRYKNKKTILHTHLTRTEAQKIVQKDIEINPIAEKYMICFDSMDGWNVK